MKILLIDKNLLDPLHRVKWRALAATPGVELTAVTPDRWRENYRAQAFEARPDDGFPIRPLPVLWPGYENRGIYRAGLDAAVREAAPDVLLAFEEPYSLFAWQAAGARARQAPRARLVLHTWNNLRGETGIANRPRALYEAIERRVLRRAALLLAANEEARAAYAARYAPLRVVHVPFGIDLAPFAAAGAATRGIVAPGAQGPDTPSPSFTAGYVGRLLPMKGIDTLLEALARLPAFVRLAILGDGPDRERLEGRAASLGVTPRVEWSPAVPSTDVATRLAALSALVLPSRTTRRWKEQFGRVLVEAMAAGVPVVGSSSGAIPDVIGEAGLVFPEGDAGRLAELLARLAGDPAECARLSALGRARSLEFAPARFADRVHAALTEAMASPA